MLFFRNLVQKDFETHTDQYFFLMLLEKFVGKIALSLTF